MQITISDFWSEVQNHIYEFTIWLCYSWRKKVLNTAIHTYKYSCACVYVIINCFARSCLGHTPMSRSRLEAKQGSEPNKARSQSCQTLRCVAGMLTCGSKASVAAGPQAHNSGHSCTHCTSWTWVPLLAPRAAPYAAHCRNLHMCANRVSHIVHTPMGREGKGRGKG